MGNYKGVTTMATTKKKRVSYQIIWSEKNNIEFFMCGTPCLKKHCMWKLEWYREHFPHLIFAIAIYEDLRLSGINVSKEP